MEVHQWILVIAIIAGVLAGIVAYRAGWRLFFFYRVRPGQPTAAAVAVAEVAKPQPKPAEPKKPVAAPRPRSEALTLLATLQREARFVDFLMESLEGYSDAQIGAVARDVHRDCAKVLERLFALAPVVPQQEGEAVEVPSGFDPAKYRLTGNVVGKPPFHGQLAHHGWEAAKCDMPVWSGKEAVARIIAPVEVELK
jgi:hypothetical protein